MSRVEVIGDATLYLGDCREILPNLTYQSVLTDPPFGMSFQSNHRAEKHEKIANDEDPEILRWACEIPALHSRYVFCRWDNLSGVPKPKSVVTWVKNNWSMGDLEHEHARQTEVACFYPGPDHFWPGKRPTDVMNSPRTGNEHHPTEKPVSLMEIMLRWTDGTVLDPFMGSGTTGVACANLRKKFVGVELHEPYFDIACRRIEQAHRNPPIMMAEIKRKNIYTEDLFNG